MVAQRSGPRPEIALVVNPNAGRLTDQTRKEVVGELRRRFRVDAYFTTARDTGITTASELADSGAQVVVAFGGDGHVNEVANGLAGTKSVLGIIPGGTMNVFARALEIPLDPIKAIDILEDHFDHEPRIVPLGKANDRYFTFSAGCGFDAEAAERVERYVPSKRRLGELFFYWSAFRVLTGSLRSRAPWMTIKGDFGEQMVAMAVACNAGPYAYLFGRAVNLAPEVTLEEGIDLFALKSMRIEALPLYVWRVAVSGNLIGHPDVFYKSNLGDFEVTSNQPFSHHVDGEPLPPARRVRFTVEKNILRVRV
ncbi:MAG: diacylglycerol kinase family lipid kinase [Actinomycetota bacterium]|nr:diacylglycerol kinase family lipid kinase [Actinomycetota bacterium]